MENSKIDFVKLYAYLGVKNIKSKEIKDGEQHIGLCPLHDDSKTSFAFTPTEVLPAKSNHTLGIARGIIFEKCLDGQYEHEVILTYGRPPTIHLYRSRLICP